MRLSIRWRMTLWNTLALAVVMVCFAVLVYGMLRHALYEQTDRLLQAAFGQLQATLASRRTRTSGCGTGSRSTRIIKTCSA